MTRPGAAGARPRGFLVAGIVVVVVSVLAIGGSIVWWTLAASTLAEDAAVLSVPGQVTTMLEAGDHALWTPDGEFLTTSEVTITGPPGGVRPVGEPETEGTTTLIKGVRTFSPQVGFTVPSSGSYTVRVDDAAFAHEILVGPAPATVDRALVVAAISFAAAVLGAVGGLILLSIGIVKRLEAKRAPLTASVLAPPVPRGQALAPAGDSDQSGTF